MSSLSILLIPSTWILLFRYELKHNDERILSLADTSSPFRSDEGLDSAYPNFLA